MELNALELERDMPGLGILALDVLQWDMRE